MRDPGNEVVRSRAGFHQGRSRSRSLNQKRSAIRSIENQTDGVGCRTSYPPPTSA